MSKARVSSTKPGLGGFADEDETEERNHALSSPVKGNRRLDSAVSSLAYAKPLSCVLLGSIGSHPSGAFP
jgi:hypothetical protein